MRRFTNVLPSTTTTTTTSSIRFFSTQDPKKFNRLRKCVAVGLSGNTLRGRSKYSYDFEKRIRLIAADSRQCVAWPLKNNNNNEQQSSSLTFDPTTTVVTDVVTKEELELGRMLRPHPMPLYYLEETITNNHNEDDDDACLSPSNTFDGMKKRLLQKDADTNLITIKLENSEATAHLIQVIEPDVRDISFQKMEAQIELVTAFRNILLEFFEVSCPSKDNQKMEFFIHEKPKFSVLRVPPLSLAFHAGKFNDGIIEKMHHASLIQAFHRCSPELKDWFGIHQDDLTIELFVPRSMLESFQTAWSTEAWEIPRSQLIPEKLQMYPGMQMPESLLENAPGFIGKREELKALALPYEERVVRLKEIEEEKFQARLRLAESGVELSEEEKLIMQLEDGSFSSGDGIKIVSLGKEGEGKIF